MRAVVQRVLSAAVHVEGEPIGTIEQGLLIFLGVGHGDGPTEVEAMARKITGLRIFEDEQGRMNLDLQEVGGSMLVVSQFTLYGDCRKGRRPSFVAAMEPQGARALVDDFVRAVQKLGVHVETGQFQADMKVSLVNDGPVTLLIDSNKEF